MIGSAMRLCLKMQVKIFIGSVVLLVYLTVFAFEALPQETNSVNGGEQTGIVIARTNSVPVVCGDSEVRDFKYTNSSLQTECERFGVVLICIVGAVAFLYKHRKIVEVVMWFMSFIKSIFGWQKKDHKQPPVLKNCADNGDATMIAPNINGSGNTVNISYNKSQTAKSRGAKEKRPGANYPCQDNPDTGLDMDKLDSWLNRRLINLGFKRLQAVDGVKVRCPKDQTIIFVIDDMQGKDYEKGLKSIGYGSVRSFARYPTDNDLKECAIIIFDVRGVGNSAGSDGFALAKHYKAANPLKKVIVRSGYLTQEQIDGKGDLDDVLDKNRDMCEQVDPLLRRYVEEMGNPVQMWKRARLALISKYELRQVALWEHKYVQLINSLADASGNLPGNWMATVNNVLGVCVF